MFHISIQINGLRNRNVWTQFNCMPPPGHSNVRDIWFATHVYPTLEYSEADIQPQLVQRFLFLKKVK